MKMQPKKRPERKRADGSPPRQRKSRTPKKRTKGENVPNSPPAKRAQTRNIEARRWAPKAQHRAALHAYLAADGLTCEEIAKETGYSREGVVKWFEKPEFLTWWHSEIMARLKVEKHHAFLVLKRIFEDERETTKDRVQAVKVWLERLPDEVSGRGHALRELFEGMEALPLGSEVTAAMRDGVGSETLVRLIKRGEGRAAVDDLMNEGRDLGVTECSSGDDIEKAATDSLAALASGYGPVVQDAEVVDRDTGLAGTVSTPSKPADANDVPGEGVGGQNHDRPPGAVPTAPLLRTLPSRAPIDGPDPLVSGQACPKCKHPTVPSKDGRVLACRPCRLRWLNQQARVRGHCPECATKDLVDIGRGEILCRGLADLCNWRGLEWEVDWRDVESGRSVRSNLGEDLTERRHVICPLCRVPSWSELGVIAECCGCGFKWDHSSVVHELEEVVGPPFSDCSHGRRGEDGCDACHRNRMLGMRSGAKPSEWDGRHVHGQVRTGTRFTSEQQRRALEEGGGLKPVEFIQDTDTSDDTPDAKGPKIVRDLDSDETSDDTAGL
jgi:hypothetical protein